MALSCCDSRWNPGERISLARSLSFMGVPFLIPDIFAKLVDVIALDVSLFLGPEMQAAIKAASSLVVDFVKQPTARERIRSHTFTPDWIIINCCHDTPPYLV
jgi:hypothetical protein